MAGFSFSKGQQIKWRAARTVPGRGCGGHDAAEQRLDHLRLDEVDVALELPGESLPHGGLQTRFDGLRRQLGGQGGGLACAVADSSAGFAAPEISCRRYSHAPQEKGNTHYRQIRRSCLLTSQLCWGVRGRAAGQVPERDTVRAPTLTLAHYPASVNRVRRARRTHS